MAAYNNPRSEARAGLRWGVIGHNTQREQYTLGALTRSGASVVARTCDGTGAKRSTKAWDVPRLYQEPKSVIEDNEVDIIYIATHPATHSDLVKEVVKAGKGCFINYPIGRSHVECQDILDACKDAGVPLFCGGHLRHLNRIKLAKQVIDQLLGQITTIHCCVHRRQLLDKGTAAPLGWHLQPQHSGGGLFVDIGSATIDALDYLLGPLQHVHGDAVTVAPGDGDDVQTETAVAATFRVQGGGVGTASFNFVASLEQDLLTVDGTHGRVTLSLYGNDPILLHTPGGRVIVYECDSEADPYGPLFTDIDWRLGEWKNHRNDGVQAEGDHSVVMLRCSMVMNAVLRSFYRGRNDGFWRRPNTWNNKVQSNQ